MSNPEKKRYPQVRPKRHGGYSLIVMGESEEHRAYLLKHLAECREGICDDLGGERSMTMAQIILTDRIVSKLGIIRCIEERIRESGTFQENSLALPLKESYLAYSNSIRLDLLALEMKKSTSNRILTPFELADKVDRENEAKRGRIWPRNRSKRL